jgi:hypothetical protein
MKKKTVQSNEPPAWAKPYILSNLQTNEETIKRVQPRLDKYSDMQFDTYGRVSPGAEEGIRAAQLLANRTLAGDYLSERNPYIDRLISDTAADIRNNVGASFSGAGRYVSGLFGDTLADNIGRFATQIRADQYDKERERQIAAAGLAQELMSGSQGLLERAGMLPLESIRAATGTARTAYDGYGKTTTRQSGGLGSALLNAGLSIGSAALLGGAPLPRG